MLHASMNGYSELAERMGIVILEAAPLRVVGTMPVEGNRQPYGLLHGGASCVLAETLGSIGAALHARECGMGITMGLEINLTHHKSVRRGSVTGVAEPLHLGRAIATYEIVLSDEHGDRLSTARLTALVR